MPELVETALLITKFALVAPEILPPLVRFPPFFSH